MTELKPYTGGRSLFLAAAVAGVLGLALTAFGFLGDARATLAGYLIAVLYWLGLALGALALVMANHAARAKWNIALRRGSEATFATAPLFALLFVPIVLGAPHLYNWAGPATGLDKGVAALIEHRHGWLNPGFFTVRAAVYFLVWIVLTQLMLGWSTRQDQTGAAALTVLQRKLSGPGLVLLGLTLTFAAFDWMMSLHAQFYSTIFGLYYFAGSFVGSLALLCIACAAAWKNGAAFGPYLKPAHFHNLGKLLCAFVAFWAYVAFSQYMLIWVGNLPSEIPWVLLRREGGWQFVGVFLIVGHFVGPFFLLLSRELKRTPGKLALVALWILFVHYIDLWWTVMPAAFPDAGLRFHWTQVTSFVGVGGAAVAFALFRARGRYAVPIGDPYLEDSLQLVQS